MGIVAVGCGVEVGDGPGDAAARAVGDPGTGELPEDESTPDPQATASPAASATARSRYRRAEGIDLRFVLVNMPIRWFPE